MQKDNKPTIRIVVADDHVIFMESICEMLERFGNIQVVGSAIDGDGLYETVLREKPDVVVSDYSMPGKNLVDCVLDFKRLMPDVQVLVLSMFNETSLIVELLDAGATGYILKQAGKEELVEAIETVYEGKEYFSKDVSVKLIRLFKRSHFFPYRNINQPEFSAVELQVIKLICEEKSSKEIAVALNLTKRAVDAMREKIQKRTGAKNVVGILLYALRNGMVTLD
jgi:DNA-binding NarL/FixJ family response regulator